VVARRHSGQHGDHRELLWGWPGRPEWRALYFRILPGLAVASTIGRWPGIDIRAPGYRTGGYLAGPGSVVDGAGYVIDRDVPAAPLPCWLASLLTTSAPVS
jgi:hypothetical protein